MSRRSAVASAFAALAGLAVAAGPTGEDALAERAARLHREALVVDGHNDVTSWMLDYGFDLGMDGGDPDKRAAALYWVLGPILPKPRPESLRTHTDLRRLRAGGVDAQFFSIWVHPRYMPRDPSEAGRGVQRALDMIDVLLEQARRHPDDLELATSAGDVRRIAAAGKIAALMGLEGGHAIEDDLANLRRFHELGVRYMTLAWQNTNGWADSSTDDARHGGLSDFGREVVREMNRLGMMVDISHVSDETFQDALEVSRAPVIASHSSARALVDHPRNMSDDMLRAVARNGGVVMINFSEMYLDPRKAGPGKMLWLFVRSLGWPATPLAAAADHIEHVARVAGIDHVGLGSDFDGVLTVPEGLEDVAAFPNLTLELAHRGLSDDEIRKVLGENVLRVLAQVEAVAGAAGRP